MKPSVDFRGETTDPESFHRRVLRAAGALRSAGVSEGDVVALLMRNAPAALEVMLAARWIGALWCPINWHFKTDEVRYILSDAAARVLVADADLLQALGGLGWAGIATFVTQRGEPSTLPADARPPSWEATRDATPPLDSAARAPRAAMFYTSGSTGRPKGIRRAASSPEQVARGLEVMRHVLGFAPGMRALVSAPMYHSAPNSYCVGAALENAHLFIEERFDAERTLRLIEQHRISHAYLVPTMFVRMLRLPEAVRRRHDLSSMRFVASTGSPCPIDVKRAMIEWCP